MRNKKGFTLIELLAVIIILSLVMLIAVPMVLNVIEKAKKGAMESDAKLIISEIKRKSIFDENFDYRDVAAANIEEKLGIKNNNYSNVKVYKNNEEFKIVIIGKEKYDGYTSYGTIDNMKVIKTEEYNAMKPEIVLKGDNPTLIEVFSDYTELGATATDEIDGDVSDDMEITGSVNKNTLGSYTITYKATNSKGNIATKTRTVQVLDRTKPVITINGNSSIIVNIDDTYTDAGATATDNYDSSVTVTSSGTVITTVEGTYTITYTATDSSGNEAIQVVRTVIVKEPSEYVDSEGVNRPRLVTGMTAVKYNTSTGIWDAVNNPNTDTSWYDYANKEWANARTADGSMWVWIPRYIYKISSNWHSSTIGTIQVQFSKHKDDNWNNAVIGNIDTGTTANASNNKWTNHPGFTFGSIQLTGIWVAKFEPSVANQSDLCYTNSDNTNCNKTTLVPKIIPNAYSWRNISLNNIYTVARGMEKNSIYGWGTSGAKIDTHLMKNAEWGAIAYLAESTYGKNAEIWMNYNANYITGCAGAIPVYSSTTECQQYMSINGKNASTTGNIYGVYDMVGGASEVVTAYINNANTATNGSNVLAASSEYREIYSIGATDGPLNNYNATVNKKGDAIYETSNSTTGNDNLSWYNDSSYIIHTNGPWITRGGNIVSSLNSGIYNFHLTNGVANVNLGWRPTLLIDRNL